MPTCAPERSKRAVHRPKIREIVPRNLWPNFRDHRKSVDASLMRILCSLQRAHGWSFVSEGGLRKMICEDVGHMPGMDTVRRALDRLAGLGLLYQEWLIKGGVMPDGSVATSGVRLIRVAMNRAERQSFARKPRKRQKTTGRVNHRMLFELMTSKKEVAPAPAPDDSARAFETRRQAALAAVRELQLRFDAEDTDPAG